MLKINLALALATSVLAQYPAPAPPQAYSGGSTNGSVIPLPSILPAPIQGPSSNGFKNATTVLSRGGKAICVNGYVPVYAETSANVKFNYSIPANETVVTETFLAFVTSGSPFLKSITTGYQMINGTYDIWATYCTPLNNTSPSKVQLLTHGIGFDRTYWDFAPGYSYVDIAAAHGYASFFYDRLGVGQSEKANPIQVVQAPLEIAIAHSLASSLRNGTFSNSNFSKVVGVGHSFGSIISSGVTQQFPTDFDATILTGYSMNSSGISGFTLGNNFALANVNSPLRFANLNNGYVVADSIIGNQIAFFRFPGFDPYVLKAADATKQTVTFGEFFTQSTSTGPALNYTSPLAVVNGAEDLPFCSGNCSYPTNLAAAVKPALYPNVANSSFAAYLAPTTGHGLNLHYSAHTSFTWIQNFLASHGL